MDFNTDRFAPKVIAAGKSECICERPRTHLICITCHRVLFGRVHKKCQKHPSLIYLLDLDNCSCGGRLIEKLSEASNGRKSPSR